MIKKRKEKDLYDELITENHKYNLLHFNFYH